ncbi:uroporphyrinogen-III synthase [Afifella aestuarii]|uniref:uroporphyrinogen-III synthase n=1 Tax=Afifella aestuarii TaxID=1909496 RepID=UPI000FE2A93C|nr:uroporphyrinogen-III synthase [Afifella aestuarii]
MRLVVTRPEPDGSRTAHTLIALGHEVVRSPALAVVPLQAPLPEDDFQAVLVTSANAVRALAAHAELARLQHLPLLAVGDRTAAEGHHLGFPDVRSAGGDVNALAVLARETLKPEDGPVLYLAANSRAGALEDKLAAAGFEVVLREIYRSEPVNELKSRARDMLASGEEAGILIYSQQSAATFARTLETAGLTPLGENIVCFCLSDQAAAPLRPIVRGPVLVSDRPDQASLFDMIARYRGPSCDG